MPRFPPDLDKAERRRILELRHHEGLSYREIADEVDRSKSYVGDAINHRWERGGETLHEPPYEWPAWKRGELPGQANHSGDTARQGTADTGEEDAQGTRLDMGSRPSRDPGTQDVDVDVGRGGSGREEAEDDEEDEDEGGRTIKIGGR